MRVLVIDTCGDAGSVALGEDAVVVASEVLPLRGASSALLPAVSRLLASVGWTLSGLDGAGVVSGPGSFTGVRVGLAAAKGLCEAVGLRLVGVSRLAVLADAAGLLDGCAVMDAGRGEVYARDVASMRERLCGAEDLGGCGRVVVAEEKLVEQLAEFAPEVVVIGAADALGLVVKALRGDGGDAALVEANYVRAESDIYSKNKSAGVKG